MTMKLFLDGYDYKNVGMRDIHACFIKNSGASAKFRHHVARVPA
jgi:hypothetical protein